MRPSNGKYDPLYYNMMRDNIAKQARADNPTEHDFIDTEFMHITWRDPANRVIQSLTQDVNAYEEAAKSSKNKMDTVMLDATKDGTIPYAAYKAWQADPAKMEGRLMTQIAQKNLYKSNLQMEDLRLGNLEKKQKLTQDEATKTIGLSTDQSVALALNSSSLHLDEIHDPISSRDLETGISSGAIPRPDANTAIAIRQQHTAMADNWEAQYRASLNAVPPPSPGNPHPKPMSYYLGSPAAVDEQIARGRKQILDRGEFFANGDTSVAAGQKQFLDNALSAQARRVQEQFPAVNLMALGPKLFGKDSAAYNDWFGKITNDPNLTKDLGPSVVSVIGGMMSEPSVHGQGPQFTMSDAFKRAQSQDVKDPAFYGALVRHGADALRNPAVVPEAKAALGNGIYGDKHLVDLVNDSQIGSDGRISPGKSTLVSDLVNDKIGKEAKHTGNAQFINNYVSTGTQWVQSIMHSEIATLNKYQSDPNLEFRWDNENTAWKVEYKGQEPSKNPSDILRYGVQDTFRGFTGQPDEYAAYKAYPAIKNSVDKLNLAIQSAASISREFTGEDVNTMVARMMIQSGLDPSSNDGSNGNALIQSIKTSATQKPKPASQ